MQPFGHILPEKVQFNLNDYAQALNLVFVIFYLSMRHLLSIQTIEPLFELF